MKYHSLYITTDIGTAAANAESNTHQNQLYLTAKATAMQWQFERQTKTCFSRYHLKAVDLNGEQILDVPISVMILAVASYMVRTKFIINVQVSN